MSSVPTAHDYSADKQVPIKRALVSVFDKTGLDELVKGLHEAGVELVSTGGSAALIESLGLPVTKVEELTGFPECLDGRVKTLHPRVHAGVLADRRIQNHIDQLDELGVEPFDLVVVNLYPFAATVAAGGTVEEIIEKIDIGGPTMVRAAAKNHPSVAIVTDGADYAAALAAARNGGFTYAERKALALKAFVHTASYDTDVATWMGSVLVDSSVNDEGVADGFAAWTGSTFTKQNTLRYGENPHQKAAIYTDGSGTGLAGAQQLHGKEMSYNNYVDTDAARRAANDFDGPAVAIIKHANPCGVATADDIATAHAQAHACDPVSAFGGVIASNRPVSVEMAKQVAEVFTEVIVAPGYEDGAVEILQAKKNIRILVCGTENATELETRPVSGGLLVQEADRFQAEGDDPANWTLATGEAADEATLADLAFAWKAVRAAKSNAILLAKDGGSVGIGMGQVNRVDSCKLAVERANTLAEDGAERARGSVAASDAFFPFEDGPQILINAGVKAIVQPGGSVRDALTIEACKAAGVTMYFTGTRHFFH
ncbi:bifunctional phosphoribosylaminoimidazolecarboxamide formyltransferase/IMP cyclohydrolase [Nocardioides yefusunii]|uniref:Bifunctional purine biosynthesis protein PurH n=1 Tax=Nocardioides yefusunii TaxID=2500546 RepID=A0ABW1QXT8_9ACTN|nr:bifunctional phosphoribosylaminoimidazolecarboxamide formyltransferase/IMP cyclohydrolase [Nocardioides yefusunii]